MSTPYMKAAALAFVVIGLVAPKPSLAATIDDVLKQTRAASGGNALDRAISFHATGTIAITGVKGTFDEWADAASGAQAETLDAGPFSGGGGFDGTDAWNQDASGVVWVDGGKAGRYAAILTSYLSNSDLLRPAKRGVVSYAGRKVDKGVAYDVVDATPPNGLPLQVWITAATHLPARVIATIGTQTTTTALSDYRVVSGIKVPFHEHQTTDEGNEVDAQATSMTFNPPGVAAHVVKPVSHVSDYSIAGGDATTVPIDLIDNHVYLSVMINGKGPYHFAFDTGGANVIDSSIAQQLGLQSSGAMQGGGVGNQTETVAFAKVATLSMGAATVKDQYFAVLPVRQGFSVASGVPLDGLIGFEVLARYVTTFDYANRKLTFRMPSAPAPPSSGADVVPFVFNQTIPQIVCQLDGVAGDCSVDTGSRAAISVLTPFWSAHPELMPANATGVGINGFGVGGPALGRIGRLTSLQIGATKLQNVIADYSVQKKGYFANPFIAGNIGGGVWRRFTVVFDYTKQTMALTPNADFDKPEPQDRSGLFLIVQGGVPVVIDARPGTPGAQAGLTRGDSITAIKGVSTTTMDLQQVRALFMGPAGTSIPMTVKSKTGETRDVTIVLGDYV